MINQLEVLHWNGYDILNLAVNGFDPPEESIRNGNLTQHSDTSIGEHAGELSKINVYINFQ